MIILKDEVKEHFSWEDEEKEEADELFGEPEEKKEEKKVKKKKKAKKKGKKKNIKKYMWSIIILIIAVSLFVVYKDDIFPEKEIIKIVAIVNNEPITSEQLDKYYTLSVPEEMKDLLSKNFFLENSVIPEILLLQEAEKERISVDDEGVDFYINNLIARMGLTEEEFILSLEKDGFDIYDVEEIQRKRIIISRLIENKINSNIVITEKELKEYYNENKNMLLNQSFEEAKDDINLTLFILKQQSAIETYIKQLESKAEIELYPEDVAVEELEVTFKTTGDEICRENGKPVIRLFSASIDPHSRWISNSFNEVTKEYKGRVIAHNWQIDTGDDLLTEEIEEKIPKSEFDIYRKYNNEGSVPTFIFGCKYVRIGNGYEAEDNLLKEEAEFREIIESLI